MKKKKTKNRNLPSCAKRAREKFKEIAIMLLTMEGLYGQNCNEIFNTTPYVVLLCNIHHAFAHKISYLAPLFASCRMIYRTSCDMSYLMRFEQKKTLGGRA